jgi:predicted glycogen debranching enzyme
MLAFRQEIGATVPLPVLRLGRDVCSNLATAEASEWLVTNGIGGYASGTVSGQPTRGYHGLLVAALAPPVGRTVMLATVLETVSVGGKLHELGTLRWTGGATAPRGADYLDSFRLEGSTPVWRYVTPRCTIEKRLFMDQGANTTRIDYVNLWSDGPVTLSIKVVTDFRDYHGRSFASDWLPAITATGDGITVAATEKISERLHVRLEDGQAERAGTWWRGFDLAQERARGLTSAEDHVLAGTLQAELRAGATVQLVASSGEGVGEIDPAGGSLEMARQISLLDAWRKAQGDVASGAPDWVAHLVLAADQFIARRELHDGRLGHTVMAGFHWFADWGRDTMIGLPGLTVVTGRPEVARSILRSFADVVDGGMIPNRFPDAGTTPEYNTVDATLWFIHAIEDYVRATNDAAALAEFFPVLESIIDHMVGGTRYGIRVDPADGLLAAGEPGVQLTWMDAKVGDWVVTPRIGKPVEVNALWLSSLRFAAEAARRLGKPDASFVGLLEKARTGFARFWNAERGYCFDVLDGPSGHEAALRPNQILAARAGVGGLSADQAKQVVLACEAELVTPAGLRSLATGEPGYLAHHGGDQLSRDAAYHQGTVWAWLIGPFIEAHLDVFGDEDRAAALLEPFADQLRIEGLGTLNEIFEAAPPHAPRGCIAQAWSVAEVLRAWHLIEHRRRSKRG